MGKASYNLSSPNSILQPCDPNSLKDWIKHEITAISTDSIRNIISQVSENLTDFVSWPQKAVLLWEGCDRVPAIGQKQKYHRYPSILKEIRKTHELPSLDTRPNGPAIFAFHISGGVRHPRFGSSNAWEIHHLYSGKFPHSPQQQTLHAKKRGDHFTQSAGLVAIHPIANSICDEFPLFTWLLRAESFLRFGYDPDHVFGTGHDRYGFVPPRTCDVVYTSV